MTDRPPPFRLLIGEFRSAGDWMRARSTPPLRLSPPDDADGAPVITLPGFLAGDLSMIQMRHSLRVAGFRARGWQLGSNLGARPDTFERIHARVSDVANREGRPVHLVGWSLGGIFAREYAKRHPETVASVISMGSPFSGSRRANHAWRLYRVVAGHSVDNPPVDFDPADKPPVPTYALWSALDGIVAPNSARGLPHESDRQLELGCGHLGFAFAPDSVDAVIRCIKEAEALRSKQGVGPVSAETGR